MYLADVFIGSEAIGGAVLAGLGYVAKDLYQDMRLKRTKPSLGLEIVPNLAPSKVDGRSCSFARLSISNAPDRETATGVSVQIEEVGGPSDPEGAAYVAGCYLAWAKADRGKPYVEASSITLPGGGTRQVDLVHLNEGVRGEMIVDVRPQPGNHLNYFNPGSFSFKLAVSADNAGTERYGLEVEYREGWSGDYESAAEHLVVRDLRLLQ